MALNERVLISAEELLARFSAGEPPILLDVRYKPGKPALVEEYEAGHIPGAIFVDLARDLAGTGGEKKGRKPLPDPGDLESTLQRWGVTEDREIVVYDNNRGLSAARGWWVLRWAGIENVRVLDGGYRAWLSTGGETATGPSQDPPGRSSFLIDVRGVGHLPVLELDDVEDWARENLLVDARKAEVYRGEWKSEMDTRYGHIPRARSFPATSNLDDEGYFLPPEEILGNLEKVRNGHGAPIGVYCGGAVVAAHQTLALRSAGIEASLFVGSWSAWTTDPNRPEELGDPTADS